MLGGDWLGAGGVKWMSSESESETELGRVGDIFEGVPLRGDGKGRGLMD